MQSSRRRPAFGPGNLTRRATQGYISNIPKLRKLLQLTLQHRRRERERALSAAAAEVVNPSSGKRKTSTWVELHRCFDPMWAGRSQVSFAVLWHKATLLKKSSSPPAALTAIAGGSLIVARGRCDLPARRHAQESRPDSRKGAACLTPRSRQKNHLGTPEGLALARMRLSSTKH